MLSALRSLSSLSELSEDRVSETTCKAGSSFDSEKPNRDQESEGFEICAQLDRVNAWRLDSQCAVRRPRQAHEDELRKGADRASDLLQHILDINAVAPAVVAGLFIPLLAQSRGSVVVVSSVAGLVAAPTRSLYSASKHAVTGYFNAFRMEVAALGIAVTVAYPGTVNTELRHSAVDIHVGGHGPAGSDAGKLSPASCAKQIVRAAALRQNSLVTPWQYALGPVLYAVVPSVVDYLAKKKYGYI
ncbi:hypothetical protein H4R27_003654 [Coemansia aciculifera]|nr:hypothetical protein H4R27_003654 [Coemansia aciculifera]